MILIEVLIVGLIFLFLLMSVILTYVCTKMVGIEAVLINMPHPQEVLENLLKTKIPVMVGADGNVSPIMPDHPQDNPLVK